MKTSVVRAVIAALAIVLAVAPQFASAHHSTAEFDYSKTVMITGTVKEFEWTNPHSYIHVLVPDSAGQPQEWAVECGTPNINVRRGWKKDSLRPGDKVTMNIAPARNGTRFGTLRILTFPDGRQLMGVAASVGSDANGNAVVGPPAKQQ